MKIPMNNHKKTREKKTKKKTKQNPVRSASKSIEYIFTFGFICG
jgi:hypothetical protein